jgi:hypothetical protein
MGTFRSTYVSPHAQSIAARIRVAPPAAVQAGNRNPLPLHLLGSVAWASRSGVSTVFW